MQFIAAFNVRFQLLAAVLDTVFIGVMTLRTVDKTQGTQWDPQSTGIVRFFSNPQRLLSTAKSLLSKLGPPICAGRFHLPRVPHRLVGKECRKIATWRLAFQKVKPRIDVGAHLKHIGMSIEPP